MKKATTNKEAQRLGLLFFKSRSKAIKGFLAELAKKKERKEWQREIKQGVAKRALHLESAKLKPANNEPSLFDGLVS